MPLTIYTVGHSTLEADAFLAILSAHGIECLADVRSYPGSSRFPQFNKESLEEFLSARGIEYVWLKSLGGRRGKSKTPSPNTALRNAGFRNYADYMLTDEFAAAIADLLQIAGQKKTAIMCAEKLFFRCHRRLISDYLTANGVKVVHLFDSKRSQEHVLSKEAQVQKDGKVLYLAQKQGLEGRLFQDY